ncbi:MAG: hypothetical protein AAF937_01860 [Planctomycetota bacterium]
MSDAATIHSLEEQLNALYQERECLNERFGVSSADDIVQMVESMGTQLRDFYDRFGSHPGFDDNETVMMLDRIKELSAHLDPMYSTKSVQFFIENEKPVLRAEWTEAIQQGDPQ